MAEEKKPLTRAEFDEDIDRLIKEATGGIIVEKVPLSMAFDWYREIDVCENTQAFIFRCNDDAQQIRFNDIKKLSVETFNETVGKKLVEEKGYDWGVTGAAAAFGVLAISQKTTVKAVDDKREFAMFRVDVKNGNYYYMPCQSTLDGFAVKTKVVSLLKKYYPNYKQITDNSDDNFGCFIIAAVAIIALICILLIVH